MDSNLAFIILSILGSLSIFLFLCSCMVRTFQVPILMFMHGSNVPSSRLDVHAWFERSKFLSLCSCMVRTFQVPILMFMHGSNVPSSYLRFQNSHAQPTVISYINFQERVDLNLSHRLGLLISTCIFFCYPDIIHNRILFQIFKQCLNLNLH